MIDAMDIWDRLRGEGQVSGSPPEAAVAMPWSARLLSGAAAWIATPLMLAFAALALGDLLVTASGSLVVGLALCAATVFPLKRAGHEFVLQAATIVSVVGIVLVGYGLAAGLDLPETAVAACLAVLAAMLFAMSRQPVHQFMCAGILIAAVVWLLDGTSSARLSLLQPITAWMAVALWWLSLRTDPVVAWQGHLAPLAWAITLTAIGLAWFMPMNAVDAIDPRLVAGLRWFGALLLPATALMVGFASIRHDDRWLFVVLVGAAIVLAWLWRWSPGITFGLSLMLVAFARGATVLLAASVAALAYYLVVFYYHMTLPLLDKALWLGMAGVLLLALHVILRRVPEARP